MLPYIVAYFLVGFICALVLLIMVRIEDKINLHDASLEEQLWRTVVAFIFFWPLAVPAFLLTTGE